MELAKKYGVDDLRLRTASLQRGEIWRLITPIFIHYGFMHIFFNLYMLFNFGSLIERRYDWKRLLMLVILSSAISNFVQCTVPVAWDGSAPGLSGNYLMTALGGMSGVVYGLFGYVWIKSIYDPKFGFRIPQSSIIIMMVWLFGCMFANQLNIGIFPPNVANWAHGIGFVSRHGNCLPSIPGKQIGWRPKPIRGFISEKKSCSRPTRCIVPIRKAASIPNKSMLTGAHFSETAIGFCTVQLTAG